MRDIKVSSRSRVSKEKIETEATKNSPQNPPETRYKPEGSARNSLCFAAIGGVFAG